MIMTKRKEEKLAQRQKEEERARMEQEIREKTLQNRTLRSLQKEVEKCEEKKKIFISMAQDAERRGFKPQYHMAATGLKMVMDSQDKANAMYLNLMITSELKGVIKDTKEFVSSMAALSRQMSDITSSIDFAQVEYDYGCAMQQIVTTGEKLKEFSETVTDSIEDYTDASDERVDDAINALIHSDMGKETAVSSQNAMIDARIKELEGMLDGN